MQYFSTAGDPTPYTFKDAVVKGLAPDNGLYFPSEIPTLPKEFIQDLANKSPIEIGFALMNPYVSDDLSERTLIQILEDTLTFDFPLINISKNIFALELFHGPTLAFKDVGARFMSRCMAHFKEEEKIVVLVATSGDTGSAVANGFLDVPGVEVVVLYPEGKVSDLQEKQFATLGANITALKVNGVFDDCQALVKKAFLDDELNAKLKLSSANSINLARWMPQSIYYGIMVSKILAQNPDAKIVVSVPSGNFGNLTAGLLAQKMGIPIDRFVAATNANDVVPEFLQTGIYRPRKSIETIANAMDVGNPSNFVRLLSLFDNEINNVQASLKGNGFGDEQISNCIRDVYKTNSYLLDPHGATAYLAIKDNDFAPNEIGVIMETAHPAKFQETVEQAIGEPVVLPSRLEKFAKREVHSLAMKDNFDSFKSFLLSQYN